MTTVGRIVLDVDADGRLLERRVRRIGRTAGLLTGSTFNNSFLRSLDVGFAAARQRMRSAGARLSATFDRFIGEPLRRGMARVGASVRELGGRFLSLGDVVDRIRGLFRRKNQEVSNSIDLYDRLGRSVGNQVDIFGRSDAAWRSNSREVELSSEVYRRWLSMAERLTRNLRYKTKSIEENNKAVELSTDLYAEWWEVQGELTDGKVRLNRAIRDNTLQLEWNGRAWAQAREQARPSFWDRLRASMRALWASLRGVFSRLRGVGRSAGEASVSMSAFSRSTDSANRSSRGFFSTWKTLPRGLRRFTFYVALFATLGENIAVLGSAAGSSLAVLAGSVQQLGSALGAGLVVGALALGNILGIVGILVTAFQGFRGELSALPPETRKVATVFRGLAKPLQELRKLVQEGVFNGLADPLRDALENIFPAFQQGTIRLSEAINRGLAGGLERLASPAAAAKISGVFAAIELSVQPLLNTVYNLIEGVANVWIIGAKEAAIFAGWLESITARFVAFSDSAEGRNAIADWLRRGRETLSGFLQGTIDLGAALGSIFDAGRDQINRFNETLSTGLARFREWTASAEGQNALAEWFSNGERVIKRVSSLLVTTGKTLNEIVDEQAIRRFEATIIAIEDALPGIGELLEVLGGLNIFGGIAAILDSVLSALNPIFIALQPITDLIGNLLIAAVEQLGVGLSILATVFNALLGPSIKIVGDLLNFFVTEMNEGSKLFRDVVNLFNDELAVAFEKVGGAIANLILELLGVNTEGGSLSDWLQSDFVPFIETKVVPAIQEWADKLVVLIDKFRTDVLPYIRDVFVPFIVNDLIPAIQDVIQWGKDWGKGFDDLRKKMAPLVQLGLEIAAAFGIVRKVNPGAIAFPQTSGGGNRFLKTGGVLTQQRTIAGEAGVELVVPLTRPLSQVDSSVRELSAIARQMYGSTGRTEGPKMTRNGAYVAPGAITVVSPYADPANVAVAALDELVERMG